MNILQAETRQHSGEFRCRHPRPYDPCHFVRLYMSLDQYCGLLCGKPTAGQPPGRSRAPALCGLGSESAHFIVNSRTAVQTFASEPSRGIKLRIFFAVAGVASFILSSRCNWDVGRRRERGAGGESREETRASKKRLGRLEGWRGESHVLLSLRPSWPPVRRPAQLGCPRTLTRAFGSHAHLHLIASVFTLRLFLPCTARKVKRFGGLESRAGMKGRGKRETPPPPRENPPTNGIVRHDSHVQKSEVTWPGIEPASPWWEASRLTAQPPWPRKSLSIFPSADPPVVQSVWGARGSGFESQIPTKRPIPQKNLMMWHRIHEYRDEMAWRFFQSRRTRPLIGCARLWERCSFSFTLVLVTMLYNYNHYSSAETSQVCSTNSFPCAGAVVYAWLEQHLPTKVLRVPLPANYGSFILCGKCGGRLRNFSAFPTQEGKRFRHAFPVKVYTIVYTGSDWVNVGDNIVLMHRTLRASLTTQEASPGKAEMRPTIVIKTILADNGDGVATTESTGIYPS
ncbi:hypothetical protein PR048_004458 [Dryococelus australis]|uniref:Uncharacterized protein n=1 Tax=Dryococelus australis TaxID=614101 RepID=A0ABQ9I5H9_9NEOP|nr:hypothetical protein PR048_004458 [Dryococelus australis]